MQENEPKLTLLADALPSVIPDAWGKRFMRLALESAIMMLIALYIPFVMGFSQPGFIALFLVSTALTWRVTYLLDENRDNIWVHKRSSWETNGLTAVSALGIFMGLFICSAIFANALGETDLKAFFGFTLEAAQVGEDTLLTRNFSAFGSIFLHNLSVLVAISILSFIYRVYGIILALSWNASIWAYWPVD